MKNTILIKLLIVFLLSTSGSFAEKYPNIPKGIDKNTFCDNEGGKNGHVIVIMDLTTDLDKARIDFDKEISRIISSPGGKRVSGTLVP